MILLLLLLSLLLYYYYIYLYIHICDILLVYNDEKNNQSLLHLLHCTISLPIDFSKTSRTVISSRRWTDYTGNGKTTNFPLHSFSPHTLDFLAYIVSSSSAFRNVDLVYL